MERYIVVHGLVHHALARKCIKMLHNSFSQFFFPFTMAHFKHGRHPPIAPDSDQQ